MSNTSSPSAASAKPALLSRELLFPFVLVTSLFALWGFANDVTNPLVKAFKDVFVISNAQSSLVQTAFYGGYATMALPAALFIRRFSYKAGIIVGLALYACGALLSMPAAANVNFNLFLVALYILTFGLAFLETTANPFILSMGHPETATRRLNLAQAFNPIGSLTGMTVASLIILANLQVEEFRTDVRVFQNREKAVAGSAQAIAAETLPDRELDPVLTTYLEGEKARRRGVILPSELQKQLGFEVADTRMVLVNSVNDLQGEYVLGTAEKHSITAVPYDALLDRTLADFKHGEFPSFRDASFTAMQEHDLSIVKMPYVVIGMVVLGVMLVFILSKMPDTGHDANKSLKLNDTFARLIKNSSYVWGVLAQTFYVGAQIMCWTFIIHYATTNLGLTASRAQNYNIVAMAIFCSSRFVCTFMLKYISPGRLLMILATGAIGTTLGTIFLSGWPGLYCLIGISACMSLMFPTIYGIALDGMGEDAKIASAGLIFAIVGGALMPPLQGLLIDLGGESGTLLGLPAVSASFVLPLVCFVFIAYYGYRTFRFHEVARG